MHRRNLGATELLKAQADVMRTLEEELALFSSRAELTKARLLLHYVCLRASIFEIYVSGKTLGML
jgi:hypothetical protein